MILDNESDFLKIEKENINSELQKHPYYLIHFCYNCSSPNNIQIRNIISKAIQKFNNQKFNNIQYNKKIQLGQIEQQIISENNETHQIKETSIPILYIYSQSNVYSNDQSLIINNTDEGLFNWLNEILIQKSSSIFQIQNEEDLRNFIDFYYKKQNFLLGFYNSSMDNETFILKMLTENNHFSKLANCSQVAIANFNPNMTFIIEALPNLSYPSLMFFPFYQQNPVNFTGNFSSDEEIIQFAQIESLPPISILTQNSQYQIFQNPIQNFAILIVPYLDKQKLQENETLKITINTFQEAALYNFENDLKFQRIIFVLMAIDDPEVEDFIEFYGINAKNSSLPQLYISQIFKQNLDKYKMPSIMVQNLTLENIFLFIEQVKNKQVQRNYNSEQEEEINFEEKLINKLVGNNFIKYAIQSEENAVVFFCSLQEKFSTQCQEEYKNFEKAAQFIKENQAANQTKIRFFTFDPSLNEVDGLKIETFPTLKLFVSGKKQLKTPYIYNLPYHQEYIQQYVLMNIQEIQYFNQKAVQNPKNSTDTVQKLKRKRQQRQEQEEQNQQQEILAIGPSSTIPNPNKNKNDL